MPALTPETTVAQFNLANNENTMGSAPSRSSRASLKRLQYRYRNADLIAAARSLCRFLRDNGNRHSHLDKYRVAERAIFPNFGAAGRLEYISPPPDRILYPGTLEAAIYYWLAACDDSPEITAVSTSADRKENFLRALYESQRGNNSGDRSNNNSGRVNFVDDGAQTDRNICMVGTVNKLCELFVGCHPDVELFAGLNTRILYLVKGLVAARCLTLGCTIEQLAEATVDFSILLPEHLEEIRNQVISCLGGLYTDGHNLGLVGGPELRYLNECTDPNVIEYLDFSTDRAADDHTPVTTADVQKLITDANEQLGRATLLTNINAIGATRDFPYDSVANIIRAAIPQPRSAMQATWEDGLGRNAPIRMFNDFLGFNLTTMDANFQRYMDRREQERSAAMTAQPATLTSEQCANTRRDRHEARGLRHKT